jgi:hypothetical protein
MAEAGEEGAQKPVRRLEVNDENMRKVFGKDLEEMFKLLAEKFGYHIED